MSKGAGGAIRGGRRGTDCGSPTGGGERKGNCRGGRAGIALARCSGSGGKALARTKYDANGVYFGEAANRTGADGAGTADAPGSVTAPSDCGPEVDTVEGAEVVRLQRQRLARQKGIKPEQRATELSRSAPLAGAGTVAALRVASAGITDGAEAPWLVSSGGAI